MNEDVERAVEAFRALIAEQLERMKTPPLEAAGGKGHTVIGLIDGDGIGPVIMESARRVLCVLLKEEIACGKVLLREIRGLTLENRLKEGRSVPEAILREIKECDVLLKGPTATPNGGTLESANVTLRRELGLYANIRPVRVPEKDIDWIFFRENSEGEYSLGSRGIEITPGFAVDFRVTTAAATRKIARAAFDYAEKNGKTGVALVTKANVIKKTDGLFSKIAHEVASEYPGITMEEWYVDIMAANLVNEKLRSKFQVILAPNLYGDILTDEAAEIQGGVGTAGSANIGDRYAMFEAIHGTAPRMVEAGLSRYANPSSILRALALLLRHIGFSEKAARLDLALDRSSESVRMTGDPSGATCEAFTACLLSDAENTLHESKRSAIDDKYR